MTPSYPKDFPAEAFSLVLSKLRGGQVSLSELVHAGWVVCGYALAQIVGAPPMVVGTTYEIPRGVSDEDLLQACIDHESGKHEDLVKGAWFPWRLVVRIVLKLIGDAIDGN